MNILEFISRMTKDKFIKLFDGGCNEFRMVERVSSRWTKRDIESMSSRVKLCSTVCGLFKRYVVNLDALFAYSKPYEAFFHFDDDLL